MRGEDELRRSLARIEGRGYRAYRDIQGAYALHASSGAAFALHVDHVQGDPFAAPSRLRAVLAPDAAALAPRLREGPARRVGLASLLSRRFAEAAAGRGRRRGSGRSGVVEMVAPGQVVLPRSSTLVDAAGGVEARFTVGLPAAGRRVLGAEAAALLLEDVPALVEAALRGPALDEDEAWAAAAANEDAEALRAALASRGLVAFLADGASLPRASGVDDRPLGPDEGAIALEAPPSLAVEIDLPHAGRVRGLAIPEGITLIVGGGFQGKSTLLRAIERGVWNHRPGDGRERCATVAGAQPIRAEDGRAVTDVDISAFIGALPGGRDPRRFRSPNASGSTSQAASLVEALEAGATALLVDEDTAATNFMIRDRRMQALVPGEMEPITPFVDRVRALYEERGVSTILVIGGSGDYLDVADRVIRMDGFRAADVTERARELAAALPTGRLPEAAGPLPSPAPRVPAPGALDARKGRRAVHARARDLRGLELGGERVDLSAVSPLVETAQVRAIAAALAWAGAEAVDGRRDLPAILDAVEAAVARDGLDALDGRRVGDLAAFRRLELAAALNRLRGLRLVSPDS